MYDKYVPVRMSSSLVEKANIKAKLNGITLSDIIRQALSQYLDNSDSKRMTKVSSQSKDKKDD